MTTALRVHLTPRSARDEVLGLEGDVLRARVTAPPVEGRANEALLRLVAEVLGVPKSSLRIVRGQRSREKLVAVEGLDATEVRQRLALRTSSLESRGSARRPGPGPGEG
jgi:uncharacterized protein (TIGR00251 family)